MFRFHDSILVLEEFCIVEWCIVPFESLEIFFFAFDKIFVRGLFYHECHVDSGIRTLKYLCWREIVSSRDDECVINLERPFFCGRQSGHRDDGPPAALSRLDLGKVHPMMCCPRSISRCQLRGPVSVFRGKQVVSGTVIMHWLRDSDLAGF